MSLNKLITFYHTVKAKSFISASKAINIDQSAISRQIADLENRLKIKLFIRDSRKGLILTDQGKVLFEKAEKIFRIYNDVMYNLVEDRLSKKGFLKIITSIGCGNIIASHLNEFLTLYPYIKIQIILNDLYSDSLLHEGDILIFPPIKENDYFIQEYLFSSTLKLYASEQYLNRFGTPKKIEDLDNHRLISYGNHLHSFPEINWLLTEGCKQNKVREPYIQVNSGPQLFNLANQGLGIVTLAKENIRIKNSNLINILPDVTSPIIKVYFIYKKQLEGFKKIEIFKNFIKDKF